MLKDLISKNRDFPHFASCATSTLSEIPTSRSLVAATLALSRRRWRCRGEIGAAAATLALLRRRCVTATLALSRQTLPRRTLSRQRCRGEAVAATLPPRRRRCRGNVGAVAAALSRRRWRYRGATVAATLALPGRRHGSFAAKKHVVVARGAKKPMFLAVEL
jgi:hypothetical protein